MQKQIIMEAQKPRSTTHTILLFIISFTFLTVWLPFIRSLFDGVTYHWGQDYFGYHLSGDGININYIFLILEIALYSVLFYGVYWMKNRKLLFGLLGVWLIHFFGSLLYEGLQGEMMFHGDALNVHLDLTYLVMVLTLISIALIAISWKKEVSLTIPGIRWNQRNKRIAIAIFAPLPIQLILLQMGEPQQTSDQIGVLISIAQALVLPLIFLPYALRK